jgi:FdhD protein
MTEAVTPWRPQLTQAGLAATTPVTALDEYGQSRDLAIAGERPLTLYLDRREIVTLMTLGVYPEALALGYLRNQRLVGALAEIKAVQVDWESEAAAVTTQAGTAGAAAQLERRTVTTGCGQGTLFGNLLEQLTPVAPPSQPFRQSQLYALLRNLAIHNQVYRQAGAVHGCALCQGTDILYFVEDVGRHNAVDAIAGLMWLADMSGGDKLFYTTGRLTSEMVIKVAQLGIPRLVSRSGITGMGLDIARRFGVTLVARAKGQHFLVFNGAAQLELDAVPPVRPALDK